MNFHGQRVFSHHKSRRGDGDLLAEARILHLRRGRSGVGHGSGGHVGAVDFLPIEIKDRAIIEDVLEPHLIGCRRISGVGKLPAIACRQRIGGERGASKIGFCGGNPFRTESSGVRPTTGICPI